MDCAITQQSNTGQKKKPPVVATTAETVEYKTADQQNITPELFLDQIIDYQKQRQETKDKFQTVNLHEANILSWYSTPILAEKPTEIKGIFHGTQYMKQNPALS